MEIKDIIPLVIIIFVVVIVGSMIFTPLSSAQDTKLSILNTGDIGENGTVYVKLTSNQNGSLSDKQLNVKITNDKGEEVYTDTVKTHATGVAIVKISNFTSGNYNINVTYAGDENYTASSISQKITVSGDVTQEEVENSTLVEQTLAQEAASSGSSQSSGSQSCQTSYSSRSSSSSSSSSGSSDYYSNYYDVDGSRVLKEYDESGNVIDPSNL